MKNTVPKNMLRKIFVLIIANMSSPFEIFAASICVVTRTDAMKTSSTSVEKYPIADIIIKNQNDNPAVTASDLNLGEDVSMLYWINKCY